MYEATLAMSRTDHASMRHSSRGLTASAVTLTQILAALSEPLQRLLNAAIAAAEAEQVELWVVGGAIRDCAAGLPVRDLDLAVDRRAAQVARRVARGEGGTARLEDRFSTATVTLEAVSGAPHIDIATLRAERYSRPGALPVVRLGASIEEDLQRRDFSVSAMALGAAGRVAGDFVDPHGGLSDLAVGRLRLLHPASVRDDATRAWRGARLAARLRLRPDADTQRQLDETPRWMVAISAERLWQELQRTAAERRLLATLRFLDAWGLLEACAPGWRLFPASEIALRHRPGPVDPAVLLAVLLACGPAEVQAGALHRLGAPPAVRRAVEDAARLLTLGASGEWTTSDLDALASARSSAGPEHRSAARVAAAWLEPGRQRPVQRALRRWERTQSPLDARQIEALGIPRGPALGEVLRRLRSERYLGTLGDAADAHRQAVRLVRNWATAGGSDASGRLESRS